MPIAYSCPHCGKQSTVADQYAGQSGPCAACGKQITIPGAPVKLNYAPAAAAAGGGLAVVAIAAVVLLVLCGGVGAALLLPAVQAARESASGLGDVETDAPACQECGAIMTRSGSCYRCGNCGWNSGCS